MFGAVAVAFGLLAITPRGDAAPNPTAFISDLGRAGIDSMGASVAPQQRIARFRQLFQADFDVNEIARFAVGRYWQAMSPEQQDEFMRLFTEYTVKAYADKLGKYDDAQLRVTGTEPYGDETIVRSQVVRTNGSPVEMDWHLIPDKSGGFKITDVYVDRVSMKATQRDEFARVIQNNGGQPSALLAVLRQQLRGEGATPPMSPPMPAR
ncbi:MAG TPA: ABC transporter substrate-binding protein [Stellaceae bacterium]|nr:ABC transporter substrate-binding protein [Stellaceae bacterium]